VGRFLGVLAVLAAVAGGMVSSAPASSNAPKVLAIRFGPDLEINPVTQDWFTHELSKAAKDGYDAVVVDLDTPGGLSSSMKTMYQAELRSKIPVIVYVSPAGARAASAGVWISQAADVLAMAPESNIGSSTPIDGSGQNLGSDLRRKVINDAAASLTALAASHHRNTKWPALAVRKASNLTSQQALKMHVIDLVSPSLPALLQKLDGYRTKDAQRPFTLHLANAQVDHASPGFLTKLLNTLIDPNLISLLFLAGIAGIGFEIFHPGVVLPGALGGIALLTALFGLSVLPIGWSGVALVLLGLVLLGIDLYVPSHGALTLTGLISLGVGLVMLFHNAPAPYRVSVPFVFALTAVIGGTWAFVIGKALVLRRRPPIVGPSEIVGEHGVVRGDGKVFVHGELWRARPTGDERLHTGDQVEVAALDDDGLVLTVRPLDREAAH